MARARAGSCLGGFDLWSWQGVRFEEATRDFQRRPTREIERGTDDVVPAKDFKRRMVVEIDGTPHMIEQIQVQTPSARGAATLYKVKARNLKTQTRTEKAYRGRTRSTNRALNADRSSTSIAIRKRFISWIQNRITSFRCRS